MNKVKISRIAREARSLFEKGNEKLKGYPPHLGGLCSTASVYIFSKLEEIGLKPWIVSGYGHTFVVCDGWLVDVTATQFGQPKIVVRDYARLVQDIQRQVYHMDWWKELGRYSNINDAGLNSLKQEAEKYASAGRD